MSFMGGATSSCGLVECEIVAGCIHGLLCRRLAEVWIQGMNTVEVNFIRVKVWWWSLALEARWRLITIAMLGLTSRDDHDLHARLIALHYDFLVSWLNAYPFPASMMISLVVPSLRLCPGSPPGIVNNPRLFTTVPLSPLLFFCKHHHRAGAGQEGSLHKLPT